LLNCLAGRQKAIVTDIKGTTRDWVSAQCRFGPLWVELIDTAGLDEELGEKAGFVEKASQEKTVQLLEDADLVLLVLDSSQSEQPGERLIRKISGRKVLTALNKSDLPSRFDADKLPKVLANTVKISAKFGIAIDELIEKMQQILGVAEFDASGSVCFTIRQRKLLEQLKNAESKAQVSSIAGELLNEKVN
jgi:tRNA modification GTPase